MTEEIITDLKQFITATVSQQTTELGQRIDGLEHRFDSLEHKFDKLEHKVDSLTGFVIEAIDTSNEETDKQLKNHERRITKLEHA